MKKKICALMLALALLASPIQAATLPDDADTFTDRMEAIYDEISAADKETLSEVRDRVTDLYMEYMNHYDAFEPIWAKISAKIEAETNGASSTEYGAVTQADTFIIMLDVMTIYYNHMETHLEHLRTDEQKREVMNDLAELAGVSGGLDDIDFMDLDEFVDDVEASLLNVLDNTTSIAQLLNLNANLQTAFSNAISESDSNFAAVLDGLNIEGSDLLEFKNNIENSVVDGVKVDEDGEAAEIIALAYLRLYVDADEPEEEEEEDDTPVVTPPVTPPTVVVPPEADPDVIKGKAKEALNDVLDQLQNGNASEKAKAKRSAVKAVEEAIKNASKLDVGTLVEVEEGSTKAKLDSQSTAFKESFAAAIIAAKAAADAAKQALQEADPEYDVLTDATIVDELTLDLGELEVPEVDVEISADFIATVKENEFEKVGINANGAGVSIPLSELNEPTNVNIKKTDEQVSPPSPNGDITTVRTQISPIVDITFSNPSTGEEKHSFAKPVDLRLNIPTQPEPDYLSIFKVETDNRLTNYGGMYVDGGVSTKRLTLSKYVVLENRVAFSDLGGTETWAGKAIDVAAAKGVIVGRGEGEFAPREALTRAEFATMLVKAFGLQNEAATESFDDVADGTWYQPFVAAAVEGGLIFGRTETQFDPQAKVTRAEMAAMTARALQAVNGFDDVENVEEQLDKFPDAENIPDSMKADIALAIREDIFIGNEYGQFNPENNSNRAQAAVVIHKLLNLQ